MRLHCINLHFTYLLYIALQCFAGRTNLEVRHGDLVDTVVLGVSHLCEQFGQHVRHDAWVVVSTQHSVRLTGSYNHTATETQSINRFVTEQ